MGECHDQTRDVTCTLLLFIDQHIENSGVAKLLVVLGFFVALQY